MLGAGAGSARRSFNIWPQPESGALRLIDDVNADQNNLQRQRISVRRFESGGSRARRPKKQSPRINSEVRLTGHAERLDLSNAERLLEGVRAIPGFDNSRPRPAGTPRSRPAPPFVSVSSVGQFDGQLAVYRGWEEDKPMTRRRRPRPKQALAAPSKGDFAAMAKASGSLAAIEAIQGGPVRRGQRLQAPDRRRAFAALSDIEPAQGSGTSVMQGLSIVVAGTGTAAAAPCRSVGRIGLGRARSAGAHLPPGGRAAGLLSRGSTSRKAAQGQPCLCQY